MDESIKRIYDLLYSPLITPYNLLSNIELVNYDYINYYKRNNELITEMKCTTEDGYEEIFYYHFDSGNFLQKIYRKEDKGKTLLFSRKKQVETEKILFVKYKKEVLANRKII